MAKITFHSLALLLLFTLNAFGQSPSQKPAKWDFEEVSALSRSCQLADVATLLASESDLEKTYGFWRMRRLLENDKRAIKLQGIENFQIAKLKRLTISKIDKALSVLPLEKDLRSKLIQSGLFEDKRNGNIEPK